MAEAFLTVLVENLNSLIQKKIGSLLGVEKEMEKFSSMLSTISAVLEDAEERQLSDRAIKDWLQKLSDVSFELDDVLDDCEMEAFRLAYQGQKQKWTQKVRSSLSCFNPMNISFRQKIANKMKEIGERLDQIANERLKFHLREVVGERRTQIRESCQTGSIITQPHVYGREEDKERIVGFLINDAINCKDISVYSVVGLGGMGKTTLAQLVFNDERVKKHFELKMWVCVSEDFDVHRLIKAIIESATRNACEALDMDPLQRRLQDILERKRFLLILDDVWNEDQEQWDKLKYVLACGSHGASIVVTTRLKKVASFMGTVPMHNLSGLSEDDCWLLFKQRAFGNEREERPNLIKIGKEIVRKCKGVPLAAKALGGLMCFKNEENEWLSVMHSEFWNLPENEGSILPALRISYLHLPIEQRRCFAYCAIFPKDYRIRKEKLIHLWMANGLISSKRGLEVEDIGNGILNELCWRSLFEDIVKDGDENIICFKMHDLVHDLAQSIMENDCLIEEVNDDSHAIQLSKKVRHLTCSTSSQSRSITLDIPSSRSLRTFMLLNNSSTDSNICLKFRALRAFDSTLIYPSASMLRLLCNLKHLRYLNLSSSNIKVLPNSICSLQHLLTLDLSCCHSLHKLPKHMYRLKGLRHLYIVRCHELIDLPPNIGQLTSLKTLTNFMVNRRKGCHLDELSHLNLGGYIHISNLEKVGSPAEARSASMSGKRNLRGLQLSWNRSENESQDNSEAVLEALSPPTNLTSLSICDYKGVHFPNWFSNETLVNVVSITLSNCNNCSELPPFGKLASLRDLDISGFDFVQYIDHESYEGNLQKGFPRLESLRITDFSNLERLSRHEAKEMFPCLSELYVDKCPKLTFSSLGSVKSFEVYEGRQQLLESIHNLHGLSSLRISDNIEMTSFPERMLQNLTSLQSLTIDRFTQLQELLADMLIGLYALKHLHISFCDELKCLPEGIFLDSTLLKSITIMSCKKMKSLSESFRKLTALQSLQLVDCPELEGFPSGLNHLTSLRTLTMSGLEVKTSSRNSYSWSFRASHKLVVLPGALQQLPSLEVMRVSCFSELASLPDWLGNLATLKELSIGYCPDLAFIPTSIQSLTNLEKLTIEDCPKLEKRCEKEIGEDWHKIAHIPDVYVGGDLGRVSWF